MTLVSLIVSLAFTASTAFARNGCEPDLDDGGRSARLLAVADFFVKNKRLPLASDISRRSRKKTDDDDPVDVRELLTDAAEDYPEVLREIKVKAAQKTMQFAVQHYRYPDQAEMLENIGWRVSDDDFEWLAPALLGEREDFFAFARAQNPEAVLKLVDRLTDAYLRAFSQRDLPKHLKTQVTRPTDEAIYSTLVRSKQNLTLQADVLAGRFGIENLRQLIGSAEAGPEDLQVLDGGVVELEEMARAQSPARFSNFRDPGISNLGRAERLKNALETKAGFLMTSVNAGIPLDEDQLAAMLRYAEDLDYDIVVFPTNQQTEGLDRRLLEHPRIHLLTHTIQNRYFRLSNIGIMPKNQNPFASLDARTQTTPGQLTIVGHPQLTHRVLPTSSNHLRATALWATGSLSKNLYPFIYPMQARTSELAKNYHSNAFLVVEKADGETGFGQKGAANHWHVRPVEFKNDPRDPAPGFTDLGRAYAVVDGQVTLTQVDPDALIPGDLHEAKIDQTLLRAYKDILTGFSPRSVRLFAHDPIDNGSINHHESGKIGALIRKFKSGELSVTGELRGLVQFDNEFSAIPAIRERNYIDSNHTYWLGRLLDERPQLHQVINGPIMSELANARDNLGHTDPLEYYLRHRPGILAKQSAANRRTTDEQETLVQDPQGVNVLPYGRPLVLGPEWRPVHVSNHGHQGNNGARSSLKSHAAGQQRNVSGDSHQTAILGKAFNVGTSTPKRVGYNDGGYSSWSNSAALVYRDGTVQILTFDAHVGAMYPRPGKPAQSKARFFGDQPLQILINDNELLPRTEVYDQMSEWGRRRGRFIPDPHP